MLRVFSKFEGKNEEKGKWSKRGLVVIGAIVMIKIMVDAYLFDPTSPYAAEEPQDFPAEPC